MTEDLPVEPQAAPTQQLRREYTPREPKTIWQENHGNLLIGLMLGIVLVGAGVLAYQQNRFVPPSFPDGSMIMTEPPDAERLGGVEGPFLKIAVKGAANEDGYMMLNVFDTQTSVADVSDAIITDIQSIEFGAANWEIPISVLPEAFAIMAFHDENSDGFPNRRGEVITERFGMTNDARNDVSLDQATVKRPTKEQLIEIVIR